LRGKEGVLSIDDESIKQVCPQKEFMLHNEASSWYYSGEIAIILVVLRKHIKGGKTAGSVVKYTMRTVLMIINFLLRYLLSLMCSFFEKYYLIHF
jgi:hypothetical protein